MGNNRNYFKFFAMILLSMIAMYGISYLNCDEVGDFRLSETRLFMNIMMGSAMSVIMLSFMRKMYQNTKLNAWIYIGSTVVFILSLVLVRSQASIHDVAYMWGMIPHHSIAILTSDHAKIRDLRVRELADHIAETQRREIAEMTWLVGDIKQNGLALTEEEAARRKFPQSNDGSRSVGKR